MAIITLTSDWGTANHYAGAVKGALLKLSPGAHIVDITHEIDAFDILQASFVLKNAFPNFPKGSIHLVGVNTELVSIPARGRKTPGAVLCRSG